MNKKFNIIVYAVILLCCILSGCASPNTMKAETLFSPWVNVVCSPEVIATNDWSIVMISQLIAGDDNRIVSLNERTLLGRAVFAKKIKTRRSLGPNGSGELIIQVYRVRPAHEDQELLLTDKDFLNLGAFHIREMVIKWAAVK